MVRSKGGKRGYLCPECNSPRITNVSVYGQSSYLCNDCQKYAPWKQRKKVSNEEYIKACLGDLITLLKPEKLPLKTRIRRFFERLYYGDFGYRN